MKLYELMDYIDPFIKVQIWTEDKDEIDEHGELPVYEGPLADIPYNLAIREISKNTWEEKIGLISEENEHGVYIPYMQFFLLGKNPFFGD